MQEDSPPPNPPNKHSKYLQVLAWFKFFCLTTTSKYFWILKYWLEKKQFLKIVMGLYLTLRYINIIQYTINLPDVSGRYIVYFKIKSLEHNIVKDTI